MSEELMVSQNTLSGFQFSTVPIDENLTDTEYMVGEIVVDVSGSMGGHERKLEKMLADITSMNKKLPTANKIMQRVSLFSSGLKELHGTRLVSNISDSEYNGKIRTGGLTALNDAALYALESSEKFCRDLMDNDYDASAVIFVLTDGGENDSRKATRDAIEGKIASIRKNEESMTSLTTCLIGFNSSCAHILDQWKKDAGFDVFIDMKDVTPSSLGKACNLISQSFSSASKQIGSTDTSKVIQGMTI